MDMVRPRGAFGSYGPAMLPAIADAAPAAVLGVLLVLGFLGDLAASAGVPVTTPAALSVHVGGTSHHKGNRQTYDGSLRRSYADMEHHPPDTDAVQDVARLRTGGEYFKPIGTNLAATVREARTDPAVSDLVLGARVRPVGGHRQVVPTSSSTQLMARKTKDKKDDDDDDDYDDDDDKAKGPAKTFKIKKHKLKKWLLPLLVGYKLKFMTLVPLLFATLALLVASAGFAGFFFAMFTAALTLPKGHH